MLEDSSLKVAEFLLQIKAVVLNVNEPFQWSSGWKSPIYCDNRKTLSYPKIRTFIRQEFTKKIDENFGTPDVIAGVATGGIAPGVLIAQNLGIPFVYVRPEPKKHGLTNQIEGVIEEGQSVIVIEDLISTGGSSLKAVEALRQKGCIVKGLVAIFSYGFEIADQNMKEAQCPYFTLTDYDTLVKKAMDSNLIGSGDLKSLRAWRENPAEWNNQ